MKKNSKKGLAKIATTMQDTSIARVNQKKQEEDLSFSLIAHLAVRDKAVSLVFNEFHDLV